MASPALTSALQFKVNSTKVVNKIQKIVKDSETISHKEVSGENTPLLDSESRCSHQESQVQASSEQVALQMSPEEASICSDKEDKDPDPVKQLVFGFWSDFFDFLMMTDVFSLGVGIIVGTIFTEVINSFVEDVITPPVGLLLGGAQLENLFAVIKQGRTVGLVYSTVAQALHDGAVTINFGQFLLSLMRFFLVTLILFWLIQAYQILKREQEKLKLPKAIEEGAQKLQSFISPNSQSEELPREQVNSPKPSRPSSPLKMVSPQLENSQKFANGVFDYLDSDKVIEPPKPKSDSNVKGLELTNTSPKGRKCPFCFFTLPCNVKVLRCGHCTTILEPVLYEAALNELKSNC